MKHDYYILIAYKPDSSDSCRGCCMADYSSDFIEYSIDQKHCIIEKLAEILAANEGCRINEVGYETIIIYKNGFNLVCPNLNEDDRDDALFEELSRESVEINDAAKALAEKMVKEKIESEKLEAAKKRLEAIQKEKDEEYRQFRKLKKKFE